MNHARVVILVLFVTSALLAFETVAAQDEQGGAVTPRANGPVRLSGTSAEGIELTGDDTDDAEQDASSDAPSLIAANGTNDHEQADRAQTGEQTSGYVPPAREHKPLGSPDGDAASTLESLVDVGAEDDAAEPSQSDSWVLGQFDLFEVLRVGGALAAVLCLLFAMRWLLRRGSPMLSGAGKPSGVVEILAKFPIARHEQLILLKLGRRLVLLHHGSSSMSVLSEVTDANEVAQLLARIEAGTTGRQADRFASMLNQFGHDHAAADASDARPRTRPRTRVVPNEPGNDVVDLTRNPRGLTAMFQRRRSA